MKHLPVFALLLVTCLVEAAERWQPITSEQEITVLFTDTTMEATLKDGVKRQLFIGPMVPAS